MRNVIILLGMLACLFGPTAIFTLVGYKSLKQISKRPSQSGGEMIALITKLVITTFVLMSLLMVLMKCYATS